ncbi:MAG: extracellular solute-binding protein [Micromonosporaceae bacterium]|nr:extracellular solute-binding protein [Micromonosporaceae bacterium]
MRLCQRRRGVAATATIAVTLVMAASACNSGSDSTEDSNTQITLTVDIFGNQGFGYDELYDRYTESHPNIKIVERGNGTVLSDYTPQLTEWLDKGSGAGDIVAIEEGTLLQFKAQPERFVNLFDYGAGTLEDNFLSWKWSQGTTADGKQLIGLGTDIGSLAICYRKDLFEQAGLPTDRESVGALWPTWQKFLETGKKFATRNKSANTRFVDSATNFYSLVATELASSSTGYLYFDTNDKLVISTNPVIKNAFDLTVDMINAGLSADLQSFSDDWNAAFKQNKFATIGCPAWMTGVIKGQAGDAQAKKWDIAQAPGTGGNWGGSFLAVPTQSKYPKEAAELARFLTGVEGQIEAFNQLGNLPSNPRALQDPAILEFTNEYFSNAPTGAIFAAGATSLKPVYMGPKTQQIRDEMEKALRSIEGKKRTADQAWEDAVANASKAIK